MYIIFTFYSFPYCVSLFKIRTYWQLSPSALYLQIQRHCSLDFLLKLVILLSKTACKERIKVPVQVSFLAPLFYQSLSSVHSSISQQIVFLIALLDSSSLLLSRASAVLQLSQDGWCRGSHPWATVMSPGLCM